MKFKYILKGYYGMVVFHAIMTYKPGKKQYGKDYFTNLDEIREYWSDVCEISDWCSIGNHSYNGGRITFFYGRVK